jgi:hypothetical protein
MPAPFRLLLALLFLAPSALRADPLLSSWFTANSGQYAQIYTSTAAQNSQAPVTTWSRGAGTESSPCYAGVHEISYSPNWVYIKTTGLASYVMGPWYLDFGKSQDFPNFPANTATIFRFPRTPAVTSTKSLTGLGANGCFVNGVAMFDMRDAYSYSHSNSQDATPTNGLTGDGIWNRDAYYNESVTFDAGNAHQAGDQYHYHADPPALRYQLGDHITYNAASNVYTEATSSPAHSPIVGWAPDGYPIYGPYGYSSPLDATSGVRRMISGYVLRDGTNGTTNLNVTGRTTLPSWAAAVQGISASLSSSQYGPAVSSTYVLGHYLEDNDYLGNLGKTQGVDFDLDVYNGRHCVTPDYPGGTYAYFITVTSTGTPVYPYITGRQYYGTATGGTVTSITETVTTVFAGGPSATLEATGISRNSNTGDVTVTWSSIDGATYKVQATDDLTSAFSDLQTNIASAGLSTSFTENAASQAGATKRFYEIEQTALATYDTNGFTTSGGGGGGNGIVSISPTTAAAGSTFTLTVNLDSSVNPPPSTAPVNSVTIGSNSGTSLHHVSQTQVTASFTLSSNSATGPQTVSVVFPGPPGNPTDTVTYTLTNGFTISSAPTPALTESTTTRDLKMGSSTTKKTLK